MLRCVPSWIWCHSLATRNWKGNDNWRSNFYSQHPAAGFGSCWLCPWCAEIPHPISLVKGTSGSGIETKLGFNENNNVGMRNVLPKATEPSQRHSRGSRWDPWAAQGCSREIQHHHREQQTKLTRSWCTTKAIPSPHSRLRRQSAFPQA